MREEVLGEGGRTEGKGPLRKSPSLISAVYVGSDERSFIRSNEPLQRKQDAWKFFFSVKFF